MHIITLIGTEQHRECFAAAHQHIQHYSDAKPLDNFVYEYHIEEHHKDKITDVVNNEPVDCIIQPYRENRQKKLLLADMDSTIVTSETLDDLAVKVGIGEKVKAITTRAMNGEIDFIHALHERVSLLSGKSTDLLNETWKEIQYTSGADVLIKHMKAQGVVCILASGGFHFFADKVKAELGFDYAYANTLHTTENTIKGTVAEPILIGQTKKEILEKHCADLQIDLSQTITVGDGANDLPMLKAATDARGLGIAFHAKPVVQAQARYNIRYADLGALRYL